MLFHELITVKRDLHFVDSRGSVIQIQKETSIKLDTHIWQFNVKKSLTLIISAVYNKFRFLKTLILVYLSLTQIHIDFRFWRKKLPGLTLDWGYVFVIGAINLL